MKYRYTKTRCTLCCVLTRDQVYGGFYASGLEINLNNMERHRRFSTTIESPEINCQEKVMTLNEANATCSVAYTLLSFWGERGRNWATWGG